MAVLGLSKLGSPKLNFIRVRGLHPFIPYAQPQGVKDLRDRKSFANTQHTSAKSESTYVTKLQ